MLKKNLWLAPKTGLLWIMCLGLTCLPACSAALYQANNALDRGKYNEAIPLLLEHLEKKPAAHHPRNMLGLAYLKSDRPAAAVTEFSKVLAARPDDPTAILYLGLAYLHEKELEKTIAVWQDYRNKNKPLVEEELKRQLAVLQIIENQRQKFNNDLLRLRLETSIDRAIAAEENKKAKLELKLGDCG